MGLRLITPKPLEIFLKEDGPTANIPLTPIKGDGL